MTEANIKVDGLHKKRDVFKGKVFIAIPCLYGLRPQERRLQRGASSTEAVRHSYRLVAPQVCRLDRRYIRSKQTEENKRASLSVKLEESYTGESCIGGAPGSYPLRKCGALPAVSVSASASVPSQLQNHILQSSVQQGRLHYTTTCVTPPIEIHDVTNHRRHIQVRWHDKSRPLNRTLSPSPHFNPHALHYHILPATHISPPQS